MGSTAEVRNSFSFVRGFVTEASPLTFPEDASIDEENYTLNIDGSRDKRLGLDYETDFNFTAGPIQSTYDVSTVNTFLWETVAGFGETSFLVIQIGNTIQFFDVSDSTTSLSSNILPFNIDLDSQLAPVSTSSIQFNVSFSSGKGLLFINSEVIEPLFVEYNKDANDITVTQYEVLTRDFDGIEDGLEVDERPVNLSELHKYNLRNQGWSEEVLVSRDAEGSIAILEDPIVRTGNLLEVFPSNADIIYLARLSAAESPAAVDSFWPEKLDSTLTGTTLAPRGKFILNAFNKVRRASPSDIPIGTETIDKRPEAVSFYSGRIFLGLQNTLYYSQVLTNNNRIGRCYPNADPTAEDINQVVATDGGTIEIPEAGLIKQLLSIGNRLIVLATNGIWQIDGGSTDPFSATNNRSIRISTIGVSSNNSGVLVDNSVLFAAVEGIHSVAPQEASSELLVQNITEQTIQSYYITNLAPSSSSIKGYYDSASKKVFWLWSDEAPKEEYHDILILDVVLKAFYKYRFTNPITTHPFIASIFTTPKVSETVDTFNVIDNLGNQVIDNLNNNVTTNQSRVISDPLGIKFLAIEPGASIRYTFAELTDRSLVDFKSFDSIGLDYEAFLDTGFVLNDDQMRFKQAPIIQVSFNQTETSFIDNGSGGVDFDFPSSCLLAANWNWTNNSVSGKVTSEQEVYRFRRNFLVGSIGESFIDGLPVVTSRTKLRGRGRALHLSFRSPAKKHTELLGWSILYKGNDLP